MTHRRDVGIVLTGVRTIELQSMDRGAARLQANEIIGETLFTLISTGTELALYLGRADFTSIPGYAAVFRVQEVGSEVQAFKPGDLAFCMGPHRSVQRVSEKEALLLPGGLSPAAAVFARMMNVSMSTLSTTKARPPQRVMVSGLGLVGNMAAQLFAASGYSVTAYDPVVWKREAAAGIAGGAYVSSLPPVDDPALRGTFALVVECSGHEQAVLDGSRMVGKNGEVVMVGVPWRRQTEAYAHELLHLVFHNYVVLRSGWEWDIPLHAASASEPGIFTNLAGALQWLATGKVNVDGLYEIVSPKQAAAVYEDLAEQRNHSLGLAFDWSLV
ncbi:zinc-binding alcohol dehydrogenase [Paenibacillus sp. CF384]|uniref:zinc-dependent alcohol dehydrogenase n=1 Tax=Paenibacillus sp. CF384 TaxID=1884382 RepID=UPI000894493D|nr:zinc-binding alcohol dehydrogenase [Paenibacillus sp. CF384]SDX13528.1 Threonine dehydrogenase [Paenibacillus sp. CF384]